MATCPESPTEVVPDWIVIAPDTPIVPAFAVSINIDPDEASVLNPEVRSKSPP